MFEVKEIEWNETPVELAGVYHRCSCCGEPVIEGRLIEQNGELYCIPCFKKIKGDYVC
ncbi:MAG: TraR/DksA C4-type zinc finger protein [Deltaproteobacteria bacterium]|nr:TraR/DksA C4-type zinc finger protein [Deltaproteobacteria bacterium]